MREVKLSVSFYHPALILVSGHLFFLVVYIIAPVRFVYRPESASVIFYFSCLLLLVLQSIFNRKFEYKRTRRYIVEYNEQTINRILFIIIVLTLLGVLLRIIDRFYIRGLDLFMSSYERKLQIGETETSLFSIVSAFLYPMGLFIYPTVKLLKLKLGFLLKVVTYLLFIYPSIDVLLTGNRGVMIVTLGIYVFLQLYTKAFSGNKLKIIAISILLIISFILSLNVFITRISSYGFTPKYSANNSVYTFTTKPNDWANEQMSDKTLKSTLTFAYTNFCQYYVHGFFEFCYLIENFEDYPHTLGRNTFYIIDKFLAKIIDGAPIDLTEIQPRTGIYTTFLGPVFVDFGYFIFFFLFFFGIVLNALWRQLKQFTFYVIPIYIYLSVVLFFFPVVNLIQSGLGMFVISSYVFYLMIFLSNKYSKYISKLEVRDYPG